MRNKTQQTTKYLGVYIDQNGNYFYQSEFGTDRITGKRIRKKGRSDVNGKPFTSASEANKELTRLKREYHKINSYSNYKMTYGQFMETVYIPFYQTEVEESTFDTRIFTFKMLIDRFGLVQLRSITIEDIQKFRTWLLTSKENGGTGYSQSYASLIFGAFRKSLDKAVEMQYLEYNISKRVKAISKGKAVIPYWTKQEFEMVISKIYINDFYEHMNFVMLFLYFTTGVRVNEGTALYWNDVDLVKKRLRVHHMLILKSKNDWKRNSYTKTEHGKRVITLDDDTIKVLDEWRERQRKIGLGTENSFIFTFDGLPVPRTTISGIMERYSERAGAKRIQAKGLRHSHASYLINEFNVSVLVLSQRMGHSSPEITLKHYAHMWVGADAAIAEAMTGNIQVKTADKQIVKFNGNQCVNKSKLNEI